MGKRKSLRTKEDKFLEKALKGFSPVGILESGILVLIRQAIGCLIYVNIEQHLLQAIWIFQY